MPRPSSYAEYADRLVRGDGNTTDDIQKALQVTLGGPLGWYELASGKKIASNYVQDALDWHPDNFTELFNEEDVYNSLSDEDWKNLRKMDPQSRLDWVKARKTQIAPELAAKADAKKKADTQAQEEAEFQKWRKDTMVRLDAFSKEMGMPVEELIRRGDLGVMNAGNDARVASGNAAYAAGLGGGGVSSMNTQRAVTDAQSKYQLQRQGLGLGATNSLLSNMGQMAHSNEATRQYEQGMNLQLQQANELARQRQHAEGQGKQAGMFGLAGGIIGGAYTGSMAGASAGYQLGSGLGGQMYGQYNPKPLTYPGGNSSPGSGSSGLGGWNSRNRYGGSQ